MSEVYVLELEGGHYYVGLTGRDDRVQRHFLGTGAAWTRKHKPLKVLEVKHGDKVTEKITTLEYMRRFGWTKVRGYAWTNCNLTKPPMEL